LTAGVCMKFELYLDDINRDIFSKPTTLNSGWKKIYSDVTADPIRPKPSDDAASFNWKVKMHFRREDFGGLFYDGTNNRVFKLDDEAFEALGVLWVMRKTSDYSKIAGDKKLSELIKLLEKSDLIEYA
tara:strand:- start:821 stop:1204 length:384 start_codon:yes stop_codon:yes gene_type:complete